MAFVSITIFAGIAQLASAAPYRRFAPGINFAQAASAHVASKDIIVAADPSNGANCSFPDGGCFSIGVIPGGKVDAKVVVIDNGTNVVWPSDVAVDGDTAYVADPGSGKWLAFQRGSDGTWKLRAQWNLADLVPPCKENGVRYGQPEAVAVGPNGEVYVSVAMQEMKRCLFHPFDKCCEGKLSPSTAVMRLDLSQGDDKAVLQKVFNGTDFFRFTYNGTTDPNAPYHIRGMTVTDAGDIVIAGYGDDGGYYGHSAYLWEKKTGKVRLFAGQAIGQDGKAGDGGNATMAIMALPWGVTSLPGPDSANGPGPVYISEAGNSDVRAIVDGKISTVDGLTGDLTHCRKLHRGSSPHTLLLTLDGLSNNMGSIIEFDVSDTSPIPLSGVLVV